MLQKMENPIILKSGNNKITIKENYKCYTKMFMGQHYRYSKGINEKCLLNRRCFSEFGLYESYTKYIHTGDIRKTYGKSIF